MTTASSTRTKYSSVFGVILSLAGPATLQSETISLEVPAIGPSASTDGEYGITTFDFIENQTENEIHIDTVFVGWRKNAVNVNLVDERLQIRIARTDKALYKIEDSDIRDENLFQWSIKDLSARPSFNSEKANLGFISDDRFANPLTGIIAKLRDRTIAPDFEIGSITFNGAQGQFILQMRSPTEREYFGCSLRAALARPLGRRWQLHANIWGNNRLGSLCDEVMAKPPKLIEKQLRAPVFPPPIKLLDQAWKDHCRNINDRFNLCLSKAALPPREALSTSEKIKLISSVRDTVARFCQENALPYLDPYMRGMLAERLFVSNDKPDERNSISLKVRKVYDLLPAKDGRSQLLALDAAAGIGSLPTDASNAWLIEALCKGFFPLGEGVVLSHWGWPVEDEPMKWLVNLCETADSEDLHDVALEAIVRTGNLKAVPLANAETWFRRKFESGGVERFRAIQNLMNSESGRSFLLDRINKVSAGSDEWNELIAPLKAELSAAIGDAGPGLYSSKELQRIKVALLGNGNG